MQTYIASNRNHAAIPIVLMATNQRMFYAHVYIASIQNVYMCREGTWMGGDTSRFRCIQVTEADASGRKSYIGCPIEQNQEGEGTK